MTEPGIELKTYIVKKREKKKKEKMNRNDRIYIKGITNL